MKYHGDETRQHKCCLLNSHKKSLICHITMVKLSHNKRSNRKVTHFNSQVVDRTSVEVVKWTGIEEQDKSKNLAIDTEVAL